MVACLSNRRHQRGTRIIGSSLPHHQLHSTAASLLHVLSLPRQSSLPLQLRKTQLTHSPTQTWAAFTPRSASQSEYTVRIARISALPIPYPRIHLRRQLALGSARSPHPVPSVSACFVTCTAQHHSTTPVPSPVTCPFLCADMPTSTSDSSQRLKYPPVQVSRSLEKLDLDTLIMRSTSRRPQDAGSSLEDSGFEFLGDSLIETSDDEAHTESIASTDGNTPDDASSFSDDDADYGTDAHELQHSTTLLADHIPTQPQTSSGSMHSFEDSTLTEVSMHAGEHVDKMRLDEEQSRDDGVSQGFKIIRSFPDAAGVLFPVFEQYECSEVRLVVKAAMLDRPMPTPESYSILYVGMPDKWVEDVITAKISAALMAGPRTSRSIMVQGQLEPYGPIMHVDRCVDTKVVSQDSERARVALRLQSGKELLLGGRVALSPTTPDLVVFCHPSAPVAANDAHKLASLRDALKAERIPFLELTSIRHYGHGQPSYDSQSLSVCIEGRENQDADFELKEVLPIDHFTFSDLDAAQINRHLALISPRMMTSDTAPPSASGNSMWKTWAGRLHLNQSGVPKMMALLTVLSAMVFACLFGPVLVPMLQGRGSSIGAGPLSAPSKPDFCSSPVPSDSRPFDIDHAITAAASAPSISSTPKGLSVVPPQVKPRKQGKKGIGKVAHYDIIATDHHHFTLFPSEDISKSRKKPQLQIRVTRQAQVVPIRYNRTISGIYIVELEQRYPIGHFNVSIASYSKPLLQQSFQIALGRNQSVLDQLRDLTLWTVDNTQNTLANLSANAAQGLKEGMTNLEASARLLTDELRQSTPRVKIQLQSAKDTIRQHMVARTEKLKQVSASAWAGVQEATGPIRRSSYLSKLRTRAIWARCKVERTTGVSSIDGDGKESWACSKLRELS